jgi:hypothetical protein
LVDTLDFNDVSSLNKTFWTTIQGAGKFGEATTNGTYRVMIKPRSLLAGWQRHGIAGGSDLKNERAAYLVNRALGGYVEMPPVTLRQVKGLGYAAVQTEVNNYDGTIGDAGEPDENEDVADEERIAMFDALIGNLDRHKGNVLARFDPDRESGERGLIAIDHSLAFPDEDGVAEGNQHYWRRHEALEIPADGMDALRRLVARRAMVDAELRPLLTAGSRRQFWGRATWMLQHGTILSIEDFNARPWGD